MVILLALLLLTGGVPAGAETVRVGITVSGSEALPSVSGLQAGLQRLFTTEYGRFASLSFERATAADAAAQVEITARDVGVTVSTTLTRAGAAKSLSSTVPGGAPASLLATIAGDIAFLLFSSHEFSAFPLSPPPRMTALLPTDLLAALLPGNQEELEPIGLASGRDGVTVSFPHGFLTLGPLFRITSGTARDILAQSGGREPLQLSGVARDDGDVLYLLSERAQKIVVLDPRAGSRQVVDAPGLSPLPARLLDPTTLAAISDARGSSGITLYSLRGEKPRVLSVGDSYVSAFSTDAEGNIWAWDVGERRIRVLTIGGSEVFAVKPLFRASLMPLPQQLEVLDDGSFLLGGSGELWRFESTGIPVWRLTRIPGRPAEQLPASFALAADRSDGSFVVLDAPSRRLLSFSPAPSADAAGLASLYERLDVRAAADLQEGAALAAGAGLTLVGLHFDTLLTKRGGTDASTSAARREVVRDRMRGAAQLADGLAGDLLASGADAAYRIAGEAARALMAEAPDDVEAAATLQQTAARRQDMSLGIGRQTELRLVTASVKRTDQSPCDAGLQVLVRVRNAGTVPLSRLRVHANLPGASSGPSLASLDVLAAGEQRDIPMSLAPASGWAGASVTEVLLAVIVTWERGGEGSTTAFSLAAPLVDGDPSASDTETPADALACRAEPADALLADLADGLLGVSRAGRDPVPALAAVLDSLAGLRAGVPPSGQAAFPGLRAAARGLDSDERAWAVLAASLGASLGVPAGLLSKGDRVFAVFDTGLPLADAIGSMPELTPFASVLDLLSRDGELCLPVSGLATLHTAAQQCAEALVFCSRRRMEGASVSWLDSARDMRAPAPVPLPFPLVLPVMRPAQASWNALIAQVAQALRAAR